MQNFLVISQKELSLPYSVLGFTQFWEAEAEFKGSTR